MNFKSFLIPVAIVITQQSNAQFLKLESGQMISKYKNENDIFSKNYHSFYLNLGADYWQHKHFYLSSEVGFANIGGKDVVNTTEGHLMNVTYSKPNITFNTTFRAKQNVTRITELYLGAGMAGNLALNKHNKTDINIKNFNLSSVFELGGNINLAAFSLGLNAKYYLGLNNLSNTEIWSFKQRGYSVGMNIRYKI